MDSKLRRVAISASMAVILLVAVIVVAINSHEAKESQGNRQNQAENIQKEEEKVPTADLQIQSGQVGDDLSAFMKDNTFYSVYKIPANTYDNQAADILTVTVKATLIVSADADEDAVYKVTAAIFDNIEAITKEHAKGAELSLENATQGLTVPFHAGAAKYFKEKGIEVAVQ